MAYREKGRGTISTGTNEKHHVNGHGAKPSVEVKRDKYRLKELAEGIQNVTINIQQIDASALKELDEAVRLFVACRAKTHPAADPPPR